MRRSAVRRWPGCHVRSASFGRAGAMPTPATVHDARPTGPGVALSPPLPEPTPHDFSDDIVIRTRPKHADSARVSASFAYTHLPAFRPFACPLEPPSPCVQPRCRQCSGLLRPRVLCFPLCRGPVRLLASRPGTQPRRCRRRDADHGPRRGGTTALAVDRRRVLRARRRPRWRGHPRSQHRRVGRHQLEPHRRGAQRALPEIFERPGLFALANFNGSLYAGGSFGLGSSASLTNVARFNGTRWVGTGSSSTAPCTT